MRVPMMNYEPPFSITPQILNAVARISERVGAMGGGFLESEPQLRRRNRKRYPHHCPRY
jgi:hypothetical protein